MKKLIKKRWQRRLVRVLISVFVLCAFSLKKVDYTPFQEHDFYKKTITDLKNSNLEYLSTPEDSLSISWAKKSILPTDPTPVIGHRKFGNYTAVKDTPFVSIILLGDQQKIALISFDLITPPTDLLNDIKQVAQKLSKNKIKHILFSSTHTHSSIGGWTKGLQGKVALGGFQKEIVDKIKSATKEAISEALSFQKKASTSYNQIDLTPYVNNRIYDDKNIDPYFRYITFTTADQESILFNTFQAHATVMDPKSYDLTTDYPGILNRYLEKEHYTFSLFFAGGVGSHQPCAQGGNYEHIVEFAHSIGDSILNKKTLKEVSSSIKYIEGKMYLPQFNFRLAQNWQLSPWLTELAMGSKEYITIQVIKIGDVIIATTPCDFSGELTRELSSTLPKENPLIVSSFNGDYIGYITPDHYYKETAYFEMRELNWYGPYSGSYMSFVISSLIKKIN